MWAENSFSGSRLEQGSLYELVRTAGPAPSLRRHHCPLLGCQVPLLWGKRGWEETTPPSTHSKLGPREEQGHGRSYTATLLDS